MTICTHCHERIEGERVRLDAGLTLDGKRIRTDVNLHDDCYGPWMLAHYPWLCRVTSRERSTLP